MATIDELKKIRLKKLERIKKTGFLAFPEKTKRTHRISETIKNFNFLSKNKKEIVLVGRIRKKREHGGSTFLEFEDGTGKIQAFFKKDRLGETSYQFFLNNFDIGDFIEIKGILFKTRKGEKTIETNNYKMLAKSLLPLPEKWHGLLDIEERYRKRYLDLIFNPEVKKKFEIRSKIIKSLRGFLEKQGFLEVETPILQPIYGGASAQPFKTHLNVHDMDLFLRISPELYLKRLLVGGFEKIYEIGKCFRNEGMDKFHNPDFTMLELYWAYANYKDLMNFIEKMFENLLKKVFGVNKINYQGQEINFKIPWPRIEYCSFFKKRTKINLEEIHIDALKREALKFGIKIEKGDEKFEIADKIYKKVCQNKISQPTFLIHHPLESSPLAKQLEKDQSKLARFQLIVGGLELVNGYSELNDPIAQKKGFERQEKKFKKGLGDAQRMDNDYIEALEYGMPPAAGIGIGIDRLVALLTDSHNLREIILFPTMKSKN